MAEKGYKIGPTLADKIISVVKRVEATPYKSGGDSFRTMYDEGAPVQQTPLRRGTVTAASWPIGTETQVTLANSQNTVMVTNYSLPLDQDRNSFDPLNVIFARAVAGTVTENVAVEIENADVCGKVKSYLIDLHFESCFGSGAAGYVAAAGSEDGGVITPGGITEITLSNGGSGYAAIGRTTPTVLISGAGVSAAFTAVWQAAKNSCELPYYEISSVSVTGGYGYVDGEVLRVTPAEGCVAGQPATLVMKTSRTTPTLTASLPAETSAGVTLSLTDNGETPMTWRIATAAVASTGSNCPDRTDVVINVPADVVQKQAGVLIARGGRTLPVLSAIPRQGTGATLSISTTTAADNHGRTTWSINKISVASGGGGYTSGSRVDISCNDGVSLAAARGIVSSVSTSDGAITEVQVEANGKFYKPTGKLDVVQIRSGGLYYKEVPESVEVKSGGQYWKEDGDLQPITAAVTVTLSQDSPSNGSGAVLVAKVGGDGKIESVTITNAGINYQAYKYTWPLRWRGTDFASLPGYVGGTMQILGSQGGCLQWFAVDACGSTTTATTSTSS
jgi:hypothetical protein